jgi:hypothetical protein
MEKKTENIHPDEWLKDLPVQSEVEGFKPEEMLTCPKCERKSPPTRLDCFYCGAELPVSESQSKYLKLNLRKLEVWEKGYNVIFLADENSNEAKIPECARLLDMENDEFQKIIHTSKSLPLARVESVKEAEMLVNRLKDLGVESFIINDEILKIDTFTQRLRGIEFLDDKLILIRFNSDEIIEISKDDIALIVTGAIFERKIEATESLKRKEKNKILDSSEVSRDGMLIDFYEKNDSIGYRIELSGFDFSCLGAEKSLLAKDNILKLLTKLREVSPDAKFDDDYLRIRAELSKVWEVDQKIDSLGVDHKSLGKIQRKSITTISNLSQFTRYSRLQFQLL